MRDSTRSARLNRGAPFNVSPTLITVIVVGLIEIEDEHVPAAVEEAPDARKAVLDIVRLGKAVVREQVPYPLFCLDLPG